MLAAAAAITGSADEKVRAQRLQVTCTAGVTGGLLVLHPGSCLSAISRSPKGMFVLLGQGPWSTVSQAPHPPPRSPALLGSAHLSPNLLWIWWSSGLFAAPGGSRRT